MPILKNLRKIYGRASNGSRSREAIRITVTSDTMNLVRNVVEFKRGGEGSAFFELSVRMMIALLYPPNSDDPINNMEIIASELEHTVESPYFQQNIEMLGRLLKS